MAILEVRNLSVDYITDETLPLHAVQDISFSVEEGQTLGLVGESGCGKTTVMLSLMRLLPEAGRIVQGEVVFEGQDLLSIDEAAMRAVRWKGIAMVFQGAMNALNPVRTVDSQISEAILLHGLVEGEGQARRRAGELLELVGISAERGRQYPHEYSGGMRQRAMIAMSLACMPRILIADEPTTALDVMIQAQIIELLERLQKELNLALVLVTHDLGVVAEMCDQVLVMYGGTVAEYASSDVVYNAPRHPYTQRLLQAFPDILEPGSELASIPGVPPRLDALPPGCRFQPRCFRGTDDPICQAELPGQRELVAGHVVGCHLAQLED
jgi:oligopeptide/dipeptide ABC transporter ATP-binding protein